MRFVQGSFLRQDKLGAGVSGPKGRNNNSPGRELWGEKAPPSPVRSLTDTLSPDVGEGWGEGDRAHAPPRCGRLWYCAPPGLADRVATVRP